MRAIGARFALIGGLALASHRVVRATQDVDLLVDAERADQIDAELLRLGYRNVYRSADAATYVRGDERLDLLYAHRAIAQRLLEEAAILNTTFGELRVVHAEGLIGFKLQALVNDPRRTQDLEDIRALLRANRASLDMEPHSSDDPYQVLDDLHRRGAVPRVAAKVCVRGRRKDAVVTEGFESFGYAL